MEVGMVDGATVSEQLAELVEAGFQKQTGSIEAIFIRPVTEEREDLQEAELTKADGVKGDRWLPTLARRLPDGSADPKTQITMMNVKVLDCVSGGRDKWGLAGDQLIVDLDVSEANLPVGQRLSIGDAVVEVTEVPHTGCSKFRKRYGEEGLDYINAEGREPLRLRGVYVMVVEEATVRVGEKIEKI
jgi:hypothetical protein